MSPSQSLLVSKTDFINAASMNNLCSGDLLNYIDRIHIIGPSFNASGKFSLGYLLEEFDAGTNVSLLREEDDEGNLVAWKVVATDNIDINEANNIHLVDHAWTYRVETAREDLKTHPTLLSRMLSMFDGPHLEAMEAVEWVMERKWVHSNFYWHGDADEPEDQVPLWYICDELGTRIRHSDQPNARLIPFRCGLDNNMYSLLFFTNNVEKGEEITIDRLEGPSAKEPLVRKALMNIWNHLDLSHIDYTLKEPEEAFFESCRVNETLPNVDFEAQPLPTDRRLRVYAEYWAIGKNLSHERFEMTDDEDAADIIWKTSHFKDFKGLSERRPGCRINQFPFESVVTTKDLLAIVSRRSHHAVENGDTTDEDHPSWLPLTFNLKTELVQFVSCFQNREKKGLDNHWIVKPWNLARGLDTSVASNLSQILRLSLSGPKIGQKYLNDPVLFYREEIGNVKFDIRYIILLQSVRPLKLFAYKRFWLRFANIAFDLSELDEYQKHFTVMNYGDSPLKQMFCHDFVKEFERQYPQLSWSEVESSIFSMFKAAFEGASGKNPPCGIASSPQSAAMYAVDLMLEWTNEKREEVRPKLLEINWGPDCARACDYYPEFFNNVFSVMFLKETDGQNVALM